MMDDRTPVDAAELAALQSAIRGVVITPTDARYADSGRLFNAAITHRPVAFVQVVDTADVVAALAFARRTGRSVSVLGGGHGVAGTALAGDLVIDLTCLRGVRVDSRARVVSVGGGATWSDVDAAAAAHGLAVPGGRVSHTGVGGLTLGGGDGWLSNKYGLTSDNLLAAELVTADGRVVTVSNGRHPELFWALRGGGGNFGVVTRFSFRAHPVGPMVGGGMLLYRLADAPVMMQALVDLVAAGHRDLGCAAILLKAPPAPFVPGDVVGHPVLAIVPAWFGDLDRVTEVLRPLRETVQPLTDATAPMPYPALQSMLDSASPYGLRQRWAAGYVPTVSTELVTELGTMVSTLPSAQSSVIVSPLSGAAAAGDPERTAFSQRSESWLVHSTVQWTDPQQDEAVTSWTQRVKNLVGRHGASGTYLNVENGDDNRTRWAFGEQKYRRLQEIKSIWDPADVFRHCHHIPPLDRVAGSAGAGAAGTAPRSTSTARQRGSERFC